MHCRKLQRDQKSFKCNPQAQLQHTQIQDDLQQAAPTLVGDQRLPDVVRQHLQAETECSDVHTLSVLSIDRGLAPLRADSTTNHYPDTWAPLIATGMNGGYMRHELG